MARTPIRATSRHQRGLSPTPVGEGETIAAIRERIVEEFRPLQIILFGSRARGDARHDSDFDLLVVMPEGASSDVASALAMALHDLPISKDVLVATPTDIGRYGDLVGYVYRPALKEGKVIYGSEELQFAPGELMTDQIKQEVLQRWLRMARTDLKLAADAAEDELTSAQGCYLSQQAAEKLLKAILVSIGIEFPLTHDLAALWKLVPQDWTCTKALEGIGELSKWAVQGRYVGEWSYPTFEDAQNAVTRAQAVSAAIISDFRDHGIEVTHG